MTDSSISAPSVFESFNARNLSPSQVAARFIPPPRHFDDLILRRHSLVVGPRGSGKTTLLKMLQLPALAAWKHPKADVYRSSIDFTGVFVAADVSWGAQLGALGRSRLPQPVTDALGLSAFTTHVLISLTDAMRECLMGDPSAIPTLRDKFVNLTKDQEVNLCQTISKNWRVSPDLPTFHGIKLALRERLSEIAQISRRESLMQDGASADRLFSNRFLYLSFLECVTFAIEAFNEIAKQPDRRWAFLFDELEIAPREIRRVLFSALRSTDHRLLFKLSMSPYHEDADVLETATSAMPEQDYQTIELWYARKEEGYFFCEALLRAMLVESNLQPASAEDLFGASFFDAGDTEREANISAYRPGTTLHRRFKSLFAKDVSFARYLARHGVDLDAMHLLGETERAGLIRKGTSVIAVRDNFRSLPNLQGAPSRLQRSRKTPTIYTGSQSLFAITEGNPRWFIGVVGPMLRDYVARGKMVPRSVQAKAITTATNRFRALLRTIPYRPPSAPSSRGLLTLLDVIGASFHGNVVSGPFNPDPPLSFVVDSTSSAELLAALGKALNAGAIILASEQGGDALVSSLRGKRFRLSYLLAPGYGIPLTLGRPAALSQVLERGTVHSPQMDLLGIDAND